MTPSEMLDAWGPALVQILATDPDGYTHFVGTGFAISCADRRALFVTATHVLEGVRDIHRPIPRFHPSTPDIFVPPSCRQLNLDERGLRAFFYAGNGKVDSCRILSTAALDGLDIAFFTLEHQGHYDGPGFPLRFELDSRPVRVGERVLAIGSRVVLGDQHVSEDRLKRQMQLSTTVVGVGGHVLETWIGGREGKPWPGFACEVETKGGMSGGPVLRALDETVDAPARVGVCGVISRGGSVFADNGASTIAAIWPAMLTDVPVGLKGWGLEGNPTILQLVQGGYVTDVSEFHESFRVHPTADATKMLLEVVDRSVYG